MNRSLPQGTDGIRRRPQQRGEAVEGPQLGTDAAMERLNLGTAESQSMDLGQPVSHFPIQFSQAFGKQSKSSLVESMDWFKGTCTGNHQIFQIWGFPALVGG